MQVLDVLKQAISASARVLRWGAGIQEPARKELAVELQAICANCATTYDAVLARLVPVKNAFSNPAGLSTQLRAFAADHQTRAYFKPAYLCSQVDHLLMKLNSNLDPLKYSVDYRHISEIRAYLGQFGEFDGAIFKAYDDFVAELDQIATQIQSSPDPQERARYAEHVIREFEHELRATQMAMLEAEQQTINLV